MNDINWRNFSEENWELLNSNPEAWVLVETDVTIRVDFASSLENSWKHGPYLRPACEKARRFAFIDRKWKW